MSKTLFERSGRCVGGDFMLTVKLIEVVSGFQVVVHTGTYSAQKKFMKLNLKGVSLNQAKEKFYDVYSSLTELWAMKED